MDNPYITEFPTTPNFFAGREKELNMFMNGLEETIMSDPPSPHNIATVGDWGIGKTSFLNKCLEIAREKDCFVCKITLTPEKCNNMEGFVYNAIDEVHRAIWDSSLPTKIKENISKWKLQSFSLMGIELKRTETIKPSVATQFKNSLIELWKNLSKVPAALIMYDDLHYLANNYPDGLYDLRGIVQELREFDCRYMLIVTGSSDMFSKIRGISEPLMRFFEHFELNPFDLEETREAIEKPLKNKGINLMVSRGVIKEIYNKTQGHPYFVMFFAHNLFEYKPTGIIDMKLYNSVHNKIFEHLSATRFIKDFAIASDMEKEVLSKLSSKEGVIPRIKNVRTLLKRLEDKKLIIRTGRGKYSLYHPLFKEYLRQIR